MGAWRRLARRPLRAARAARILRHLAVGRLAGPARLGRVARRRPPRLSDGQLAECARSSFVHALGCPEAVRDRALADIEAWLRGEDLAAAAAAQSSSSQKPKTPRFKRGQKKSFSFLASHAHGGRI